MLRTAVVTAIANQVLSSAAEAAASHQGEPLYKCAQAKIVS